MKKVLYVLYGATIVLCVLALPQRTAAGGNVLTVSMWWVIFNQPAFCRGGGAGICTGADLTNVEAVPSLAWAAEQRLQPGGTVSLKASLPVTGRHMTDDAGLTNPLGAEVHLMLLTQMSPLPVHRRERVVAAFSGACPLAQCPSIQRAIHGATDTHAQGHSTSEVWRLVDGSRVPPPAFATVWRSAKGLIAILHTLPDTASCPCTQAYERLEARGVGFPNNA